MLMAYSASAQLSAGSINLGGCVGFWGSDDESSNSNSFSYIFNPGIDYFVKNNFSVRGNVFYSSEQNEEEFETIIPPTTTPVTYLVTETWSSFGVKPTFRYHMGIVKAVACFLEAAIKYEAGTIKYESGFPGSQTVKDKFTTFGLHVTPGVYAQVKPRVGLSFSYGMAFYESTTYKPDADGADNFTQSSYGLKVNEKYVKVGAYYTFGKAAQYNLAE